LKIYQIKYKRGGIQKYAYTSDFIDYYATHKNAKTKTNLITEKKQFYEEVQKMRIDKKV
jgi:hypothetical protein